MSAIPVRVGRNRCLAVRPIRSTSFASNLDSKSGLGGSTDLTGEIRISEYDHPIGARDQRAPLPSSRLEQIMSARAGAKLEQFGYDQLGRGRAVSMPQTGAVQDDYVLGPGDQIVVSLRGQENSELRAEVNRNGEVVLPRLNPICRHRAQFWQFPAGSRSRRASRLCCDGCVRFRQPRSSDQRTGFG